jgi:hypothetical protein
MVMAAVAVEAEISMMLDIISPTRYLRYEVIK